MFPKPHSLYSQAALKFAKAIKFNADKIEALELPNKFNETIFELICCRLIRSEDIFIQLSRRNTNKRKCETLQREILLKFAKIMSGEEIL